MFNFENSNIEELNSILSRTQHTNLIQMAEGFNKLPEISFVSKSVRLYRNEFKNQNKRHIFSIFSPVSSENKCFKSVLKQNLKDVLFQSIKHKALIGLGSLGKSAISINASKLNHIHKSDNLWNDNKISSGIETPIQNSQQPIFNSFSNSKPSLRAFKAWKLFNA